MTKKSGQSSAREADWIRELRDVQAKIDGLRDAFQDSDFSHGMILQMEPDDVSETFDPRFYATRDLLVETFSCKTGFGGRLIHYIYADRGESSQARDLLDGLAKALTRIGSSLSAVPKKTLPDIPLPSFGGGNQDRMARWCSTLHFLGHLSSNRSFRTEVEFLSEPRDSFGRTRFTPWDEYSSLDHFDPLDFLLTECHDGQLVEKWKASFHAEGRKFPRAIASSLTKPLMYASTNAVDKIISRFNELPKKQVIQAVPDKTDGLPTFAEHVLHELWKHHGGESGIPNFEPIKQKAFAAQIRVSQSQVSKMIEYWMAKIEKFPAEEGSGKYKLLCRRGEIHHHLAFLKTPKQIREVLTEHLDRIADTRR